jgi:exopolysaccharide production protein ExoQ
MIEQNQKKGISPAILIPLIWFLRVASRGITYWLSPDMTMVSDTEMDYLKGSAIDRNFFVMLEMLAVMVLCFRNIDWGEFVRRNRWLLILYLFMGMSVIWSGFPMVSFKRWIRTIGDLLMVIVLITEIDFTSAIVRLIRVWSYLLIPLSVLFVKYYRHLGVSYDSSGAFEMWIGVTTHKNSLGQLVCVSAFFLAWIFFSRAFKTRLFDIPVMLLALWLLNGSKTATSRTSLTVFLVGTAILLLVKLAGTNARLIRNVALVLVFGFLVGNVLTQHFARADLVPYIVASTGGDPTFTGRTFLWDELLKIGEERWLLGAGYGGFWIGSLGHQLWEIFSWRPGQAHNGFIDVYIDLGVIGLILLGIVCISTFRSMVRSIAFDSDWGRFRLVMFIMILIYNYTESSFIKPTSLLWVVFLLIAIQVPEECPEGALGKQVLLNEDESGGEDWDEPVLAGESEEAA